MSTWSYSVGEKPHTVTVYERTVGGVLYARAWDATARGGKGNWVRSSLGHRDKARAKREAKANHQKLEQGASELAESRVTLAQVFALYALHRTPTKKPQQQKADAVRAELWARVLGGESDPHDITLAQWEGLISARKSGALDARGRAIPPHGRKSVRARAVQQDCRWLCVVFNWASKWRLASGTYLMRENPVRGFDAPREKNPRRPVASSDLFQQLRAAAEEHTMELRGDTGYRQKGFQRVPSYMPELLDIAEGTARRISAICSLRYCDLVLTRMPHAPHGAIRWPAETDKQGKEWSAPITPRVRAALNRVLAQRPGIGTGYLFPAPGNPREPISKYLASHWYREVEELAGIEHVGGMGWHSLRRKWATERKHLPDVDVAAAGGWASVMALKQSYQHADAETMLSVVLAGEAGEAREHAQ